MSNEFGFIKGEICNRDGCAGIIDEYPKEGSCSCHINPPCGYCTTDTSYCPLCNWCPDDDVKPVDLEIEKRNQEYYKREREAYTAQRESFYRKFEGKEAVEKLEMRTEGHTHFTQIVRGVFPKGTETTSSLIPKVKGTFGGRFTRFENYRFEYVAYTD